MQQVRDNPLDTFDELLQKAKQHPEILEATAFSLATVSPTNKPSNRMLLLKSFDQKGFVFYTNFGSRKSHHLASNPWAAMCFFWKPLRQQVRIEGKVSIIDDKVADDYFAKRPLQSRIGAWASKQSKTLDSMDTLLKRVDYYTTKATNESMVRPPFWSGYCLQPELIEFWYEGDFRIHERVEYTQSDGNTWQHRLLFP